VRGIISDPRAWRQLPTQVCEWLEIQQWRSQMPGRRELLIETFPRANKQYLVCYPFEGRLAHQTLGMLLTRRLERARLRPLGFVANEYALAVWGLGDVAARIAQRELSLDALFDEDMLGDDLEAWLAESALMKRTFRNCAIIAGLIERRFPGQEKSRRQVTISTDLVYDVLRSHQPDHVLLRAARADASTGLLDVRRLGEMLSRIKGRIVHKALDHVSPLAVPVMLEIGREAVYGEAAETLLAGNRGRIGEGGDAVRSNAFPAHSRASGNPTAGTPLSRGRADDVLILAGVTLAADPAGAIYWPDEKLLVVADLHLEKGSAFAARGVLLPPYDTAATLARLARLIERYAPHFVVALGDNFHDGGGPARMSDASRVALAALQHGRDWLWLAGNHDPHPAENIGGRFADVLALGALTLRHEPAPRQSDGEIAGHLHPVARCRGAAARSAGAALPATASGS